MNSNMINPASTRPSEQARHYFHSATMQSHRFMVSQPSQDMRYLASILELLSEGLGQLALGVRAIYIKLDKIEQKLDRRP